jgi:hypothetical protein
MCLILNKNVKIFFYIQNILVNCFAFLMKADHCEGGGPGGLFPSSYPPHPLVCIYVSELGQDEMAKISISDRKLSVSVSVSAEISVSVCISVSVSVSFNLSVSAEISVQN